MSSYYNRFKDGPSDKPKKKKKIRTDHSTWGDIIKDATPHSLRNRKKKVEKNIKKAS